MTLKHAACGRRAVTVAVLVTIWLFNSQQSFGQHPNEITFVEQVDRNEMIYVVTQDQIGHSPAWLENEGCPPLNARKAQKISEHALELLQKKGFVRPLAVNQTWKLDEMAIRPLVPSEGKWYWKVTFERSSPAGSGFSFPTSVFVLMDGTILIPATLPVEKERN